MSDRALRVNELIRKELSRMLLTEVELSDGCLVTILGVDTSKDLKHANVWFSVLPEKLGGTALKKLRQCQSHLQYLINKELSMKPIPKLSFRLDQTEVEASKIEGLLDRLTK